MNGDIALRELRVERRVVLQLADSRPCLLRGRSKFPDGDRMCKNSLEDGKQRADLVVLGKEREAIHQLCEHASQRPDVNGGRVVGTSHEDLGRAIPPRHHL